LLALRASIEECGFYFSEPFSTVARTFNSMTAIEERLPLVGLAAKCGEPPDFAGLVRTHQAGVWRYVRFLGAEAAEADDLTQETFLALARSEFAVRDERQTAGYLRAVARNQLLALRRKQSREICTVELDAADAVWVAAAGADGSLNGYLDALGDCMAKLDGRAREVVELHYRDRAGREVIAKKLGMQPDGVKTLLRRTRQVLRECIERKLKKD
jgi:RNA polymerase sigma-70 factor, ECF subfamily